MFTVKDGLVYSLMMVMVEQDAMKDRGRTRPIDERFKTTSVPPVAGVDLEQALNYIELDLVGEEFIYDHFTGGRLPYARGTRPMIEEVAERVTAGKDTDLEKMAALAQYVANEVKWAGFYLKRTGEDLPSDLGLTEEKLIENGDAWCNEQARVMCVLTQALGYPSRLVLTKSHTLMEVLIEGGWMLVDQSFGYCFVMDGEPVRAVDVHRDERRREYFGPIYQQMCNDLAVVLDQEMIRVEFALLTREGPLEGLKELWFHNNFL